MKTPIAVLAALVAAACLTGCVSPGHVGVSPSPLVGAWVVNSARSGGVGKNLLTFSSDGTFFRSGDTHPTLSGGAWGLEAVDAARIRGHLRRFPL